MDHSPPAPPFHAEQTDDDGKVFTITQHLDVRGMTCPMPALKSLERSKAMSAGEILEVIGDWPGSKFEVPYAVADRPGLEVVRIIESDKPEDETWWIYIRRT
jgi:tRNA 2-thiouridine synthesizing protein A